ncbi:MAG TPA: enoyl-CoA hydratase/isomerase family protein [Usitatibacter sp.]|nr:enoyl-CoA hydratase/isomerase family protein [Usitatibacter sp.]
MPEAAHPPLAIEREADCWTLVLDRADKANALSPELVEALIEGVAGAEAAGVPVLAFRGNGRNLSAGFDFTGYEAQGEGDLVLRFVRIETLLQSIARSSCLTVGFAHGRNFGAGVDLFAACRWRVATPDATFRMPGLGFGLVLGTRRFASIVGAENARTVLETLATFDAQRAAAMGFATRIAAAGEWPAVMQEARDTTAVLTPDSRRRLYGAVLKDSDDADLADLVRSAAAPGLKERIARYLAAQRR